MKGKDDVDPDDAGRVTALSRHSTGKNDSAPNSSMASFLQQEKLCKELYLSMGVHPNDVADTSDEDVASILEQMSRLHQGGHGSGRGDDRNIEDILREAESLLDGQHTHLQPRSKPSSISSRSELEVSGASHRLGSGKNDLKDDQFYHAERNSSHRHLNTTYSADSPVFSLESDLKQTEGENEPSVSASQLQNQPDAFVPPYLVGTPLEVAYKRICEQLRKEVDGTLKPQLTGDFPDFKLSLPIPGLDTPSLDVPGCFNLEHEFLEERKRCLKLKADLDWLKKQHEREVGELRRRHEGQLNQVREELCTTNNQNPSVLMLQNKIKSQQCIISSHQQENEKMCAELNEIKKVLLKLLALLKADLDSVCIYP